MAGTSSKKPTTGSRKHEDYLRHATVLSANTAANSLKYSIPQSALISPHTFTSIQEGSGLSICDCPGDMPEMRNRHSVGSIRSSPLRDAIRAMDRRERTWMSDDATDRDSVGGTVKERRAMTTKNLSGV